MSDIGESEAKKKIQQFLGFDFGLKRIGIAVGQTLTSEARPLRTLVARDGNPNWRDVETLLAEWKPAALVVGLPYNIDGSHQPITDLAEQFAVQLGEKSGLSVYRMDERLSSREAAARLRQARKEGSAKRKDAEKLDAIAASIILENWLQTRNQEIR